jgi:prepilin signal peptidase PulO-like enzyme (type II secretory pathway)
MYLILAMGSLGILVGSFLGLLSYRIPNAHLYPHLFKLFWPCSHCPTCQQSLKFRDKVPLVSYFLLRKHCRFCREKIHWRYPLLEALSALVTMTVTWYFPADGWLLVSALMFSWGLLTLAIIDIEHLILPNSIVYFLGILGLGCNYLQWWVSWSEALLGAGIAYSSLGLVATIYYRITGRIGLGGGDVKLFSMLGAWLGWKALPTVLLIATLSGSLWACGLLFLKRHNYDTPIPFGPFLALGAYWVLLVGY